MVDLSRLRRLANAARALAGTPAAVERTPGKSWYRIENKAAESADVYLYDMIGEWGVTAQDFVNDLRGVSASSITLHINCEGGEVFDGLAIYESLLRHPAHVAGEVEGLAASAASFILQACDTRRMAKRARMMVHDAHGLCIGNAGDMREMANLLDDLSDNIADVYAERSGVGDRATWRAAMHGSTKASDGTWYAAQAAVDAGLADEVRGDDAPADDRAPVRIASENDQSKIVDWSPGALLNMFRDIEEPAPVMPATLPWIKTTETEG